MSFFNFLSLKNRFLVAPMIGVMLTLILYFTSNSIIRTHSDLFQQLYESNLPQVSEINSATLLLAQNHYDLYSLLHTSFKGREQTEEEIYTYGREILNNLHIIEEQLLLSLETEKILINQIDIFGQIHQVFNRYRNSSISAIELSTVDPKLSDMELQNASRVLHELNGNFLKLSNYYVKDLSDKSSLLKGSLYDHNIVTILAVCLVIVMMLTAVYFSNHLAAKLDEVNQALIRLSFGRTDIHLPEQTDTYMQQITNAVYAFKITLDKYEQQKNRLSHVIEELTDSKERYFSLLNLTATAIIAIDHTQHIVLFNKAAERMFGYDSLEITGQNMEILLPEKYRHTHVKNVENFENSDIEYKPAMTTEPVIALRKNGEEFHIEGSIAKLRLANETLMTVAVTDVTDRLQAAEQIQHQAHFDNLTSLPNRFLSLDRLTQLTIEAKRKNEQAAVLFLDLDDFKKVNDSLGHETGDKLLIEAAKRLSSVVRSGDTVGRLGGDEFIVILSGVVDVGGTRKVVENLLDQFRSAFTVDGRELILTASIGISVFPEDGDNASELLRNADSAMYHAKELGRNTYSFFTETMNKEVSRRLLLEEQMHGALDRGEFRVVYQPQIDISSGNIVGIEALLRWTNPVLKQVFPDEFIPIAEQTGLIVTIGEYVLTEALRMAAQWQQNYDSELRVAVNLSPRQFRDPNLVSFIAQALKQSGVTAKSLELEVTEGVLMSGNSFIDEALVALGKLGVGLAMDDFGTGYSSLNYLRQYPFDTLKIDRIFVSDIIDDSADRELVNATIAMAHGLGLKVVAEGVETEAQLAHLHEQDCEYAQGYLFSKPVSPEEINKMLAKN